MYKRHRADDARRRLKKGGYQRCCGGRHRRRKRGNNVVWVLQATGDQAASGAEVTRHKGALGPRRAYRMRPMHYAPAGTCPSFPAARSTACWTRARWTPPCAGSAAGSTRRRCWQSATGNGGLGRAVSGHMQGVAQRRGGGDAQGIGEAGSTRGEPQVSVWVAGKVALEGRQGDREGIEGGQMRVREARWTPYRRLDQQIHG